MDPDRWARAKELFHEALEREPERRETFLLEACSDETLREAVRSMLARQRGADGFLESPALHVEAMAIAADLRRAGSTGVESASPPLPADLRSLDHAGAFAVPKRRASNRPPWWMLAAGALFLADSVLRSWCYLAGPRPFGLTSQHQGRQHVVRTLVPGGLADRAGIRPGDRLVAVDGRAYDPVSDAWVRSPNLEIGRTYQLEVEREGRRVVAAMRVTRRPVAAGPQWQSNLLWQVATLALTATALLIMFGRPRDPLARMGALALAALSVGLYLFRLPPGYAVAWRSIPWGLGALLLVPNVGLALAGPIGLTFFLLFPRPLFRTRWPWLAVWLPGLCLLPVCAWATALIVYWPQEAYGRIPSWVCTVQTGVFAAYGLTMVAAIAANYARLTDVHQKRRLRVLAAGGAAGTIPGLVRFLIVALAPASALRDDLMSAWWLDVLIAAAFLLLPLTFAYAVLRHRLLGIRVIVRMGVQYAFARGLVLSLVPALGLVLAVDALIDGDRPLLQIVEARGWDDGLLGGFAVAAYAGLLRMAAAIDRRFFREQYDARRLLRDVAEQARRAGSVERAAPAVVARIEAALHPSFAALMVRAPGETRFHPVASAPAGASPPAIAATGSLVARLRATERPVRTTDADADREDWEDRGWLDLVELAVPITMSAGQQEALLAFGARRSEEPYTQEDLEALTAVAGSLALLLEAPVGESDHRQTSAFEECPACGVCYDTGTAICGRENRPLVPVGMPRTLVRRYRLERRLGRGGMGMVYEATDTALERRVAVKVIRDEWVHSTAAIERFRREARAAAGLDHPNVVTVHDYGIETGRRAFLVMELLDGETLRDEIRRCGRLEAARTVEVLRGVCSAVEAAHRHRLLHRDLKPENIFVVNAGGGHEAAVKVLDFGVAKPLARNGGHGDGALETDVGVLVGTVGYMAPEQMLGDPPDVSWDLWTLAVVAYESLAGAPPFPVDSRETWRRLVLAGQATPLARYVPGAPAQWQDFFDRCLALDRTRRPGSAADFLVDLEAALGGGTAQASASTGARGETRAAPAEERLPGDAVAVRAEPAPVALSREGPALRSTHGHEQRKPGRDLARDESGHLPLLRPAREPVRSRPLAAWRGLPRATKWIAGVTALAGIAAAVGWLAPGRRQPAAAAPPRLVNAARVTSALGVEDYPTWSPDGQALAYQSDQAGNWDIWVTRPGSDEAVNRTADCSADDMRPSWSPDGQWIAFFSFRDGGDYFLMPAAGGTARKVASWPRGDSFPGRTRAVSWIAPPAPAWSPDGARLAYALGHAVAPRLEVLTLDTGVSMTLPLPKRPINNTITYISWSPDGRWLAYVRALSGIAPTSELWLTRVAGGESYQLTDGMTWDRSPAWSPDSRQLYFVSNRGGTNDLWRYAPGPRGLPEGEPQRVSTGLEMLHASVCAQKLAFTKGRAVRNVARAPILADRPATWSDTTQITWDVADLETIDVSIDGRLVVASERSGNWDVWTMASDGQNLTRLTTDPAVDAGPQWKPDGREVLFHSSRIGHRELWKLPIEGGPARQVTRGEEESWYPSWSPNGREAVFQRPSGLWVVSVEDGRERRLTDEPSGGGMPSWSPDGRWVAFSRVSDGARRVWRVPAAGGTPERLSAHAAGCVRWSRDGREVYFIGTESASDGIWAVSVDSRRERELTRLIGRRGRLGTQGLATDGRVVYFMWEEARGDIWVADIEPRGR